jgi:ribosomal protein S18 acetylase RimI-like enzyme
MIEIRSLSADDGFDELISLSHIFFTEYEGHHKDFFKIADLKDEDITNYINGIRDNPNGDVIIALDGDRTVGYISIYIKTQADHWQINKVGIISGLMVHPAYRRMGIASRLLSRAKQYFQKEAVRYFTVFTSVNNRDAITFYERSGLSPLHTTLIGETGGHPDGIKPLS